MLIICYGGQEAMVGMKSSLRFGGRRGHGKRCEVAALGIGISVVVCYLKGVQSEFYEKH